jgi:SNF2 family DNA or RNA helicase
MKAKLIKNAVIVAPKSVLRSWEKELKRVVLKCAHKTMITVMESNASPLQRRRMLTAALECSHKHPHIVITTYGMISNELNLFKSDTEYWDYVVLDEAHNIKNSKTQISLACCSLAHNPETHRVMLSGTPLMNKPEELYVSSGYPTKGCP